MYFENVRNHCFKTLQPKVKSRGTVLNRKYPPRFKPPLKFLKFNFYLSFWFSLIFKLIPRFGNCEFQSHTGLSSITGMVIPIGVPNSTAICAWRNGILLPKLFWPTLRKNCSSDREQIFLYFKAEGREFAKFLRLLEQFIRTVKVRTIFETECFFKLFQVFS